MSIQPISRVEKVEQALVAVDRDYLTVYGPDMTAWSKGVRGEYLEVAASRRRVVRESHPAHPRKSSAGRRRRHQKQLAWRIGRLVPDARIVLVTPVLGADGDDRLVVTVARDAWGERILLRTDARRQIVHWLQGAFPEADWTQAQTWRADTNEVTPWDPPHALGRWGW
ncbi:hypothetical protein [Streptomyces sp. NPDC056682]|uniref:hypothetical protein n=1 Tax=Streptomyces sp. NPDC056682 TaxID=3345909 RepID=UPI00369DD7DA